MRGKAGGGSRSLIMKCLSKGVGLYAEGNQWGATKGLKEENT